MITWDMSSIYKNSFVFTVRLFWCFIQVFKYSYHYICTEEYAKQCANTDRN